jgi:Flp pilus assembly protein TadD
MDLMHKPVPVPGQFQLAATHFQAGNFLEAQKYCREALREQPDSAAVLHLLGLIDHGLGDAGLALESLQKAAGLDPYDPVLSNNLGEAYRGLGRVDEAEICYRRALELKSDYAAAGANLGMLLYSSGRLQKTVANYLNLATSLEQAGRFAESESMFRRAVSLDPRDPDAHRGLGRVLERLGRLEDAAQSWRQALALNPDLAEVQHDLGMAMMLLLRPAEAEGCFRRALALRPGFAMAEFGCSLSLLMRGDYESGLPLYEKRFEGADAGNDPSFNELLPQMRRLPRWQGEDLGGRTLLVWTEQGLGDTLMAMRYLPLLKRRGVERLIVYCEPVFVRLIAAMAGADEVVSKERPVPLGKFDCQCPLMSLPLLFGTRLETIPGDVPYARVPAVLRQKWADRLASIPAPRIGLVWAGGALYQLDPLRSRSIRLERFAPLLAGARASFVSLQKGEQARELGLPDMQIHDWMDACEDFLETAALVEQLDLVVSVDTAVAHLAGALGKPVWMLNRLESEWRWMLEREDSPWYPTMRIFRQTRRGDWDEVIGRVAREFRFRFGRRKSESWLRRLFDS